VWHRWAWTEWLAGAAAVALAVGAVWAYRELPALMRALTPRTLHDAAGLLGPEQREAIEQQHRYLLLDHDIDYRVETASGVGDVNSWAHARFESIGVGGRSRTQRGLLLVLDPEQDVVRLEVSRTLEGVFPDAFVAYLEQRQMVPFFRADRPGDGILAATELIVARAQNASASAGWADEVWIAGSGGAGARAHAQLARGLDPTFRAGPDVRAEATPEATVGAYLEAMRRRNANPSLDLYSAASRNLFVERVMTPAQMDQIARTYRSCNAEPVRIDESGTRAVIRYPIDERACSPWLLVLEEERWRLDFETASRAIRFGRGNAWRFDRAVRHPYAFAFEDWTLDRNGFPRAERLARGVARTARDSGRAPTDSTPE
jgi:uncharacterized protein